MYTQKENIVANNWAVLVLKFTWYRTFHGLSSPGPKNFLSILVHTPALSTGFLTLHLFVATIWFASRYKYTFRRLQRGLVITTLTVSHRPTYNNRIKCLVIAWPDGTFSRQLTVATYKNKNKKTKRQRGAWCNSLHSQEVLVSVETTIQANPPPPTPTLAQKLPSDLFTNIPGTGMYPAIFSDSGRTCL